MTKLDKYIKDEVQKEMQPLYDAFKVPVQTKFEDLRPLERLRAFCSFAMDAQDWIDSKPYFKAVEDEIDRLVEKCANAKF
jgi:hypothetical protein